MWDRLGWDGIFNGHTGGSLALCKPIVLGGTLCLEWNINIEAEVLLLFSTHNLLYIQSEHYLFISYLLFNANMRMSSLQKN